MGSEIQKITDAGDVRNLGELYGTRDAYRTEEEYNVDVEETLDSAGQWIALENPALRDEFVAGYIDSFVRFEKGMRDAYRFRKSALDPQEELWASVLIGTAVTLAGFYLQSVPQNTMFDLGVRIYRWCASGENMVTGLCRDVSLTPIQEPTPKQNRLHIRLLRRMRHHD